MMHSFSSDRLPSFSTNFEVKTSVAVCSSEMHSEIDNDSSEGSTVITNTANEATESTMSGTAVNDSADDDAVAKKRIDIFESTFPHKLYHILQNPDFKDIITWMPNGRSWKMIDRKEFTKRVLPLFFRHQKFSSFKRQLSGWEFLRGVKECSANEYHHPLFSRDQPELLLKMRRRKQNRNVKSLSVSNGAGSADEGTASISRQRPANLSSPLVNNANLASFGLASSQLYDRDGIAANGLPMSSQQSHLLQNINLTAQQVALSGLSAARLRLGLPIMNENTGSNGMDLLKNKLQVSDYLNAYRTSSQASTSLGNSVAAPTPAEVAIMAEIERLREQNNSQLMSLVRSGLLPSTSFGGNGNDFTPRASAANSNIISEYISRVNASAAPHTGMLTNVALACLNRNSSGYNVTPSVTDASQALKYRQSP